MISRSPKANFFAAHYDWFVSGVGLLSLVLSVVYFLGTSGEDPVDAAQEERTRLERLNPGETGVKAADMTSFQTAKRIVKAPSLLSEFEDKSHNFLASEKRVLCKKCKKAIFIEIKTDKDGEEISPKCSFCGEDQGVAKKVILDGDGDGLPDKWERSVGLDPKNPADADEDMDGDDFTNKEEYLANTDPRDKSSHPDYLDSLKIVLPLKETYLPFVFRKANKIPQSWRCEFFDPKKRDDYGRMGLTITARIGEEIPGTGYTVEKYIQKESREAIRGGEGMTRRVDVSEVLIKRKSDGKIVKMVVDQGKNPKLVAVDVQAVLKYERGAKTSDYTVVPGTEISIGLEKWKVVSIKAVGKGAEIVLQNSVTDRKRALSALEQ